MTALRSTLDPTSAGYAAAAEATAAKLAEMDVELATAVAGGGPSTSNATGRVAS